MYCNGQIALGSQCMSLSFPFINTSRRSPLHSVLTLPAKRPGGSAIELLARLPGRAGAVDRPSNDAVRPSPATLSLADPPQTAFGEGEDGGAQREVLLFLIFYSLAVF
jgi:hypothetical protein